MNGGKRQMTIGNKLIRWFWNNVEKQDLARMSTQHFPEGIAVTSDIQYINDGNPAHLLDVYTPENADSPLPVIIVVHGGGWTYGTKELNKRLGMCLSQEGFTVLNINYRLIQEARFPAQLQDIYGALNWLERRKDDYFADTNNVFIVGDSAGGHLASLTLALDGNPELAEKWQLKTDIKFRAGGLICGAFNFNSLLNLRNPVSKAFGEYFLGKEYKMSEWYPYLQFSEVYNGVLPPVFLASSARDFIRNQTKKMAKFLESHNQPYKLRFWDKKTKNKLLHVYQVTFPYYEESIITNKEMTQFFKEHLQ